MFQQGQPLTRILIYGIWRWILQLRQGFVQPAGQVMPSQPRPAAQPRVPPIGRSTLARHGENDVHNIRPYRLRNRHAY